MSVKTTFEIVDNVSARFEAMASAADRAMQSVTAYVSTLDRLADVSSKGAQELDSIKNASETAYESMTKFSDAARAPAETLEQTASAAQSAAQSTIAALAEEQEAVLSLDEIMERALNQANEGKYTGQYFDEYEQLQEAVLAADRAVWQYGYDAQFASEATDQLKEASEKAWDIYYQMKSAATEGNLEKEAEGAMEAAQAMSELAAATENADRVVDENNILTLDAYREQEHFSKAFENAEEAARGYTDTVANSTDAHKELGTAIIAANDMIKQMSKEESVSAEAKYEMAEASKAAAEAMQALETQQQAAMQAMENYDSVLTDISSKPEDISSATNQLSYATDNLAAAQRQAATSAEGLTKLTDELAKETENAGKAQEEAQQSGIEMAQGVAGALSAAGITAMIKEMAESAYELAVSFSDAESTIVLATGATGDALDELSESMMSAYAASKTGSIDDAAAAVGEINTRLGYTGDTLTETTELFLDFANATGGSAASSVANVTKLMNQWGVAGTEMESVLDKLTYAGQVSGVSVDTLSSELINNKAVLDQLGFSMDEAIAMFSEFELQGTNVSSVMTGFRQALSSGAISSLEELYDVFDDIASGAMSTAEASEIFGTRAGPAIANAASNGVFALDDLVSSLETADGTLSTTAEAAQTLSQKWEQAGNNIKAAFTNAIAPTIEDASSGLADLANKFGDFLNENPVLVQAITGAGVAMGVFAVGIAGVSAASLKAIPAIAAMGTAINASLTPLLLVAGAIGAVTAAVLILKSSYDEAYDAARSVTPVIAEQQTELEELQAEYDEVCESQGNASLDAINLKNNIDELSATIDENSESMDEWTERMQANHDARQEIFDQMDSNIQSLNDEIDYANELSNTLQQLANSTDDSVASQSNFQTVLDEVNNVLGTAYSYSDYANGSDTFLSGLNAEIESYIENQKQAVYWQAALDSSGARDTAQTDKDEVEAQLKAAEAARDEAKKAYDNFVGTGDGSAGRSIAALVNGLAGAYDAAQDSYDEALEAYNNAVADFDEANDKLEESLAALGYTLDEFGEITIDTSLDATLTRISNSIASLVEAYDEAYNAAYESFQGQFGLWDEAAANSESTVASAQAALDSQLKYWETYNNNLEVVKGAIDWSEELGVTQDQYDSFMAYIQDGSEEAAGMAQSMANYIKQGNTDAVENLIQTYVAVDEAQQNAAGTVADWKTNFTEEMNNLASDIDAIMKGMDYTDEAYGTAKEICDSLKNGIVQNKSEVISEINSLISDIKSAASDYSGGGFSLTSKSGSVISITGKATGTTNAPDVFFAGENGTELIVDKAGSTVFPHSETEKIVEAVGERYYPDAEISSEIAQGTTQYTAITSTEKTINIALNGGGKISVDGKADTDEILNVMMNNIKPVLSEILVSEVTEEGDGSYVY